MGRSSLSHHVGHPMLSNLLIRRLPLQTPSRQNPSPAAPARRRGQGQGVQEGEAHRRALAPKAPRCTSGDLGQIGPSPSTAMPNSGPASRRAPQRYCPSDHSACSTYARVPPPCLVRRRRLRPDRRRAAPPVAGHRGRGHAGVPPPRRRPAAAPRRRTGPPRPALRRGGPPTSLRSDNGPACTAPAVRDGLTRVGVTTRVIAPGSPWENGSGESCNGTLRDAGLHRERCDTRLEAQVLIAGWRREDNQIRPHSALGYRPPAPRPGNAGDPTSPPRLLGRPAGPGTHFTTGTTIGGRSLSC